MIYSDWSGCENEECEKCGSTDIIYRELTVEDNSIIDYEFECRDCIYRWKEDNMDMYNLFRTYAELNAV